MNVWVRAGCDQYLNDMIVDWPIGLAECCVQWRFARVLQLVIDVGARFDEKLTKLPMAMEGCPVEIVVCTERT